MYDRRIHYHDCRPTGRPKQPAPAGSHSSPYEREHEHEHR